MQGATAFRPRVCLQIPQGVDTYDRGGAASNNSAPQHGQRAGTVPAFVNSNIWNWQGRTGQPYQRQRGAQGGEVHAPAAGSGLGGTAPITQGKEMATIPRRHGNTVGGDWARRGAVLQAGGKAIVAKKTQIQRWLKELEEERAHLLRREADVAGLGTELATRDGLGPTVGK